MKRWQPLHLLGVILLVVVVFVGTILSFLGFSRASRHLDDLDERTRFWQSFLEDFDWGNFPWDDFPFDTMADFPWDTLPWDDMPDDFDWNQLPWDNLPDDFPWEKLPWNDPPDDFPWDKVPWEDVPWDRLPWDESAEGFPWDEIPWDELPDDFPWDKAPWGDLPADFPWGNVPWSDVPEDFPWEEVPWEEAPLGLWQDFPWTELPEGFPWEALPWFMIPPSFVPDGALPEDFYPEAWDHEHQYASDVWTVVRPPTCGEPGEETNVCTICKQTVSRSIDPTGEHTFGRDGICTVCKIRHLILMSESKTAEYSGKPLVGDALPKLLAGSATLLEGHKINAAALRFAQCSELGKVANTFYFVGGVTVIDEAGNDVSSLYSIGKSYGTLELTKRDIMLHTKTKRKKYDGTPLLGDEGKPDDYTVDGLVEGDHLVDVVFDEGLTDRGKRIQNKIVSFRIVNAAGEDVTNKYAVQFDWGQLIVT